MEIKQVAFTLKPRKRGFHLITQEILANLPALPQAGLLNLFVKHTSCALSINENYDSSVRTDMEYIYNRLVPENDARYIHTDEGADDMPSHAKSSLTGVSLVIPITDGKLNLGTWQGIYLCEFRDYGGPRKIVATIMG
jgi:secondary thiamine-phosphate synthase enzyme